MTPAGQHALLVKSVAQLLAHVCADFDDLDLIVLDLRTPHASGVDLVECIRKLDEGKLPSLVLSGSVAGVDGAQATIDDFVEAHFFRSVKIES